MRTTTSSSAAAWLYFRDGDIHLSRRTEEGYATTTPLLPETPIPSPADIAIRLRRATFNRALAEADLNAISPILARDAILITGTDSAVLSGRKAQLAAWKAEFASPARIVYVRMPDTIIASPVEPIALEHGHWQGTRATSGEILASGDYTAKWRMVGDDWMIEAEIYLTIN